MKYDIPYLVEEFNKNGYIILRHCMSDDLLSNISDANASVIKSHKTAMMDTYLRESNLMELDPRYWDLLTLEPVLTLVKTLLCDQPRLMSS